MREFPTGPWLLAWFCATALFLGPILLASFADELCRLDRAMIPRPLFIICKRVVGLLPLPSLGTPALVGRTVFVSWDVRWLDHGETTGHITAFDPHSRELEIQLDAPMTFVHHSNDIRHLTRVRFNPTNPDYAPYAIASVRGTFLAGGGDYGTGGVVVVYPRSE